MADDRTWTTSVFAELTLDGRDDDLFELGVVADWCEERGFEKAASLLRQARVSIDAREPKREHGWSSSVHSSVHFFPSERSDRTLCGRSVYRAWANRHYFHFASRICQRCAAELERRQAEFPEAWEAHLISMDEARPMLVAPELTDKPPGKEQSE